jgi:hypothetical protein
LTRRSRRSVGAKKHALVGGPDCVKDGVQVFAIALAPPGLWIRLFRLAAVSREQLREGSALSNRDFDSTPAGVCVSVKRGLWTVARFGLLGTPGCHPLNRRACVGEGKIEWALDYSTGRRELSRRGHDRSYSLQASLRWRCFAFHTPAMARASSAAPKRAPMKATGLRVL